MPRKGSSSKTAKEAKPSALAAEPEEEKNPSPAPKKSGNEIDEIYSGKKRKKVESAAKASALAAAEPDEEKKPSPAPKKAGNEIDEIFSGKKRKKVESAEDGTERPNKDLKKKSKLEKKRSRISGSSSRPRKRTDEGLAVYTAEELGIGKGDAGDTPLCPFDCNCCF